jgi:hypothetical protein
VPQAKTRKRSHKKKDDVNGELVKGAGTDLKSEGYLDGVTLKIGDDTKYETAGLHPWPWPRIRIESPIVRLNDYLNEVGRALTRAERLAILIGGVSLTLTVMKAQAIILAVLRDEQIERY